MVKSTIETHQLSRNYGTRRAVDSVELDIRAGEIFGFLGPNGAGKTTTIRMLMGFLKPTSGTAKIFGLNCWRDGPRIKKEVGYLPSDIRLYPWLTPRRALNIFGKIRGVDLRSEGLELAERFQLERDLPVRKMSRGTRQKLGLVLMLAHRPQLLILDEPTSGLDPIIQIELARCLRELAAKGCTVFFSSHTLSEVEALCHRVAIVRNGQIVADESLQSLRERAHRLVSLQYATSEIASAVRLPEFLLLVRREEKWLHCELKGRAAQLVEWAAAQPLQDIAIGQPDLEVLFHKYYESSTEAE